LLADGLFDIHTLAIDLVVSFEDGFIHRIVIFEFDESETARLACVLFSQASDGADLSKLLEICPDVILGHVFLETSDKHFLDGLTSLWFTEFFTWRCSFGFNRLSVDGVRPCILTRVDCFVR